MSTGAGAGAKKPRQARPKGLLIDQKGIQEEFGIRSRDVIRWAMSRDNLFPKPVRIIGRVYLFEREAVAKFFGLKV